MGTEELSTKSG